MNITTRLRLNIFISIVVAVVTLLTLAWTFSDTLRADRNLKLAVEMRKVAFERILLRDEYLLRGEERAETQWMAKSEALRELFALADTRFNHEEDKALLRETRKDFDITFSGLSKVIEGRKSGHSAAHKNLDFTGAESRLFNPVFLRAYSLIDHINRLHESVQKTATSARDRGAFVVVIVFLGGIIAIIINSNVIRRTLAKRVSTLGKGVETIGDGNLDYRIAVEGDDELSALALASNEMANKLQKSHTSVVNLQKEVAERKQREKIIEDKNAELERFIYTVSHDLKSPVVTVKTFLGYLRQDMVAADRERIEKDLEYIRSAADKMGLLLDDLLQMSRVGRVVSEPVQVRFRELVNDALGAVAGGIAEHRIDIQVAGADVMLYADRRRLAEIWQNLIENSIKYRGGQVSPRIEIGVETRGKDTVFFVRDNGMGIDPRHKDKVFGLFEKLDAKSDGTGLGLALVKRIVELYEGKTWLESEGIDKGACFYFTMPAALYEQGGIQK